MVEQLDLIADFRREGRKRIEIALNPFDQRFGVVVFAAGGLNRAAPPCPASSGGALGLHPNGKRGGNRQREIGRVRFILGFTGFAKESRCSTPTKHLRGSSQREERAQGSRFGQGWPLQNPLVPFIAIRPSALKLRLEEWRGIVDRSDATVHTSCLPLRPAV